MKTVSRWHHVFTTFRITLLHLWYSSNHKYLKDCIRIQDDMSHTVSEVPSVMDMAAIVSGAITLAFGTAPLYVEVVRAFRGVLLFRTVLCTGPLPSPASFALTVASHCTPGRWNSFSMWYRWKPISIVAQWIQPAITLVTKLLNSIIASLDAGKENIYSCKLICLKTGQLITSMHVKKNTHSVRGFDTEMAWFKSRSRSCRFVFVKCLDSNKNLVLLYLWGV